MFYFLEIFLPLQLRKISPFRVGAKIFLSNFPPMVTERRRSLVTERRRSLVTERRRSQGRGKENYLIIFLVTMSSTTKPFSK